MRNVVAHSVSAMMEHTGCSLEKAGSEIVMGKLKACGGEGGLVAVDSKVPSLLESSRAFVVQI